MADFVAVIRRTVDGLSDNVPEMRAKVYEKARGAVRRQLESMKPRPSDEMIERQMTKLEAAINEVENDHAEALPALDEQYVDPAPEAVATEEHATTEPEVETVAEAEPVAEESPVVEEQQPAEVVQPEPVQSVQYDEPVERYEEPVAVSPPAEEAFEAVVAEEPVEQQDVVGDHPVVGQEDTPVAQAEPETVQEASPELEEHHHEAVAEQHIAHFPEPEQEPVIEPVAEPKPVETAPQVEAAAETYEPAPEPVAEPAPEQVEEKPMPSASSEWELPEWNDPLPVAAHSETVRNEPVDSAVIVDEIPDLSNYEPVETVTPLTLDTDGKEHAPGEPSHSWAWDDNDPFTQTAPAAPVEGSEPAISDWSWPVEKQAVSVEPEQDKPANDGWADIDELLEHGRAAPAAGAAVAATASQSQAERHDGAATLEDEMEAPARPVSYRVEPKRSRLNLKALGLAAGLVLVLGGGAFAYWQNQTAVNAWVAETIASVSTQAPVETTPNTSVPAEGTKDLTTPTQTDSQTQTPTPATNEVASADTSTKFTQRLQPDGSEVDSGPAAAPAGESAAEEGKSVAAQTEAGAPPQDTAQATPATPDGQATGTQPADGQPAQPVPGQQTTADPATQQIPAGAQKMFLYEERLGQSAPTAIEGNVVWSVKEESPGDDAKPEPTIQAQINVPERGLTALMTVKRNADSSLPASHVIEFVFSLPENFEGGSIDSVQRVAMKRNEQDRGDALIAVPAKITEDFHMIALNDFPEAVATNTDLLRTRSWIDIPLTYRNGRRALLTLEKGPAGTEAFTKAMQAWSLAAKPTPAVQ